MNFITKFAFMLGCLLTLLTPLNLSAQTLDDVLTLPERLMFTISGGYWTQSIEVEGEVLEERGYYRLSAFRKLDNTSALFLQKIMIGEDGPEEALTLEIEEMSEMAAYITDIRPENSTGIVSEQGFAAYVYLKNDPAEVEPETYSIYVDDLENIFFEQASN